jgi:hypothetical protein
MLPRLTQLHKTLPVLGEGRSQAGFKRSHLRFSAVEAKAEPFLNNGKFINKFNKLSHPGKQFQLNG